MRAVIAKDYSVKEVQMEQHFKPQLILERVASGDKSAVEDCVNAYGKVIWALAKNSAETAKEAEDIVLEIFGDLWKCAKNYEINECEEINFVALIARRRLNIHRGKICDE